MKSTRFLMFFAILAAIGGLPSRAPAEEADPPEEAAAKSTDQSPAETPATATTATEAGAPTMDEPSPVKRATRGYKQPKPKAETRNPDSEGGGGGGSGAAVPRPQAPADDEPSDSPPPPTGKPAPDTMHCDMPPLHHINVDIRAGNGNRMIADATPIVCSTDPGTKHERYCQETMNDDRRRCCPAKPEGHPLRVACELILLGKDHDGVAGPRWEYSGSAPDSRVDKREDNPFLAYAYGQGIARACSNVVNVCGQATYKVK